MYKLIDENRIKNLDTGEVFGKVNTLPQYEAYKKWLAEGNTPEPADVETLEEKRGKMRITKAQAKISLKRAGLLASVKAHIATLAEDDETRILWEDALHFERLHPAIISIGTALEMTDAQLDQLFEAGAAIQ